MPRFPMLLVLLFLFAIQTFAAEPVPTCSIGLNAERELEKLFAGIDDPFAKDTIAHTGRVGRFIDELVSTEQCRAVLTPKDYDLLTGIVRSHDIGKLRVSDQLALMNRRGIDPYRRQSPGRNDVAFTDRGRRILDDNGLSGMTMSKIYTPGVAPGVPAFFMLRKLPPEIWLKIWPLTWHVMTHEFRSFDFTDRCLTNPYCAQGLFPEMYNPGGQLVDGQPNLQQREDYLLKSILYHNGANSFWTDHRGQQNLGFWLSIWQDTQHQFGGPEKYGFTSTAKGTFHGELLRMADSMDRFNASCDNPSNSGPGKLFREAYKDKFSAGVQSVCLDTPKAEQVHINQGQKLDDSSSYTRHIERNIGYDNPFQTATASKKVLKECLKSARKRAMGKEGSNKWKDFCENDDPRKRIRVGENGQVFRGEKELTDSDGLFREFQQFCADH